jgi:hypothetical protein
MLIVQKLIADITGDRTAVKSVLYIITPLFFIMIVSAKHI